MLCMYNLETHLRKLTPKSVQSRVSYFRIRLKQNLGTYLRKYYLYVGFVDHARIHTAAVKITSG